MTNDAPQAGAPDWLRDAVFYEAPVRAFYDADGDGRGDLRGLREKLPYVKALGVSALALPPFLPSEGGAPLAFDAPDPALGNMEDFRELAAAARALGLKVVVGLPLGAVAAAHPWFQAARKAPSGSSARALFRWSEDPEALPVIRKLAPRAAPARWLRDDEAGAWYWSRRADGAPALDYDAPETRAALAEAAAAWLAAGADGVQLEDADWLAESETAPEAASPQTLVRAAELARAIKERSPGAAVLLDVGLWPDGALRFFGEAESEGLDALRVRALAPRLFLALAREDGRPVADFFGGNEGPLAPETEGGRESNAKGRFGGQWITLLRDGQPLAPEWLGEAGRAELLRAYAPEPRARLGAAVRRRTAPMLHNDRRALELVWSLLFALPGAPALWYGDEIGMGDNIYLAGTDGLETPMQWSAQRNAGFSEAGPHQLCLPVNIENEYHYKALNASRQADNPASLLNWMRRALRFARNERAFRRGTIRFLDAGNARTLAFVREYEGRAVLVAANLSRAPQAAALDLRAWAGARPADALNRARFPEIGTEPYALTLGPWAWYWLSLDAPGAEEADGGTAAEPPLPEAEIAGSDWEAVFEGDLLERLEREWLPRYLRSAPWFGAPPSDIEAARLLKRIPFRAGDDAIIVVVFEVEYYNRRSEQYMLPLFFAAGAWKTRFETEWPLDRIARLSAASDEGFLADAFRYEPFRGLISMTVLRNHSIDFSDAALTFRPTLKGARPAALSPEIEQLQAGGRLPEEAELRRLLYFKFYRRMEAGPHPEREIIQFLAEKSDFRQVPSLFGALVYSAADGQNYTVGLFQNLARYETKATALFAEALRAAPGGGPGARILEYTRLFAKRLAELHLALAPEDAPEAFAREPLTLAEQRALFLSLDRKIADGLAALGSAAPESSRALRARLRELTERSAFATKTRVHHSFGLNRGLFTGDDFIWVEFDGGMNSPRMEKRAKASPLKDAAGFFFSLRVLTMQEAPGRTDEARTWRAEICAAFLETYLETMAPSGILPEASADRALLLDFYLAECWAAGLPKLLEAGGPEAAALLLRELAKAPESVRGLA